MKTSTDKQVKGGKKMAEKKVTEKKIKKTANPSLKRGQPTAAARLISSPYIKFGWHKPLSGDIKETVGQLSSFADSMYMLQMSAQRPIDSLSLRNGIFWEHRQLDDESIVSTPALDHIDLFPIDDDAFRDTISKIGKQHKKNRLHYLFEGIRSREFLLLPMEICGEWVTIITKTMMENRINPYSDRVVTDLAIIDPSPIGRESRQELINRRLPAILAEGCIRLSDQAIIRDIAIEDLVGAQITSHWQSGLVAYAISREFLRRLKTLQFRQSHAGSNDEEFLWAPFEEEYNFDAYRQHLMAACAHQTIEASGYRVRLALEVPSDDASYQPSSLERSLYRGIEPGRDEKWEIFQSPTHTLTVKFGPDANDEPQSPSSQGSGPHDVENETSSDLGELPTLSPQRSRTPLPTSKPKPESPISPTCPGPNEPSSPPHSPASPSHLAASPDYDPMSSRPNSVSPAPPAPSPIINDEPTTTACSSPHNVPIAPMGPNELLPEIPGLTFTQPPSPVMFPEAMVEDVQLAPLQTSRKRSRSPHSDDEESPAKRVKPEIPESTFTQPPSPVMFPEAMVEDVQLAPLQTSRKRSLSPHSDDEESPAKRVKPEWCSRPPYNDDEEPPAKRVKIEPEW